jgi:hypothetical protein
MTYRASDSPQLTRILEQLENVRGGPHDYRAACPGCSQQRGVSITEGDRAYRWHCFCHCEVRESLAAVGLTFDDLSYANESRFRGLRRETPTGGTPSPGSDVNRHPSLHQDRNGLERGEVEHLLRLAAAGEIEPIPVRLPPLPEPVTPARRRVADFYRLVRGVRLWAGDDRDVLFASEWAAEHIGLHPATVWRQIDALCEAGVLVHVDTLPGRRKRGPRTYLPGPLVGRDEQRAELLGAEAAVEADPPNVEPGRVEPAGEPSDVVAVLEAPIVVSGGLGASVRGTDPPLAADVEGAAESLDVVAAHVEPDGTPHPGGHL